MNSNLIKLLLIENIPEAESRIQSEIARAGERESIKISQAGGLPEGLNFLRQEEFDLVIIVDSDDELLASLEKIRDQAAFVPVIVISDNDDRDLKLKLVRLGIQDYLPRDKAEGSLLVNSIIFAIERNKTVEHLRKKNNLLVNTYKAKEDSERKLKLALANIQDIVIEINNDVTCTFINNAGINFFGRSVIGNQLSVFNSDTKNITDKLNSLSRHEALVFEDWTENKTGEKRHITWTCCLLVSITGEREGFLLVGNDLISSGKTEAPKTEKKHKLLGQLLLEKGYINENQLERALAEQHKTKILLGEILIRLGFITPEELADVLIMQAELDSE
jgi:DNA-binding NarL/FixJ family response regulator